MKTGLVVLTLNAGKNFPQLLRGIDKAGDFLTAKLAVDSASDDDTAKIAADFGFDVVSIRRNEFNHGGTRRLAFEKIAPKVDAVIFITQDIVIHDATCLQKLVASFADETVGAAYGRQLPHEGASELAAMLRAFNYPAESAVKSLADREKFGIKTAFLSDSFAAYRVSAMKKVGGFPQDAVCAEDMYVAAKMLVAGYRIAYNAEAAVRHSHEFSLRSAWKRYRDVGAFHKREKWIGETFGGAEGEGLKLLQAQLAAARKKGGAVLAAKIVLDDAIKFLAYRAGNFF